MEIILTKQISRIRHLVVCLIMALITIMMMPSYANDQIQGYYDNGVESLKAGDLLKAEMWFIRSYRSDSISHKGYEELITIYDMQGRYDKSLEIIDKELLYQGEETNLLLTKGLTLVNLEQIDEAQAYYLRAGELSPDDPQVLLAIELYLQKAGKPTQAQIYAARRQALELQ